MSESCWYCERCFSAWTQYKRRDLQLKMGEDKKLHDDFMQDRNQIVECCQDGRKWAPSLVKKRVVLERRETLKCTMPKGKFYPAKLTKHLWKGARKDTAPNVMCP